MIQELSTDSHSGNVTQREVVEGIYSVDAVTNHKHSQEEVDMRRRKMVKRTQHDIKRSETESNPSDEIFSVDNIREKMVEGNTLE